MGRTRWRIFDLAVVASFLRALIQHRGLTVLGLDQEDALEEIDLPVHLSDELGDRLCALDLPFFGADEELAGVFGDLAGFHDDRGRRRQGWPG